MGSKLQISSFIERHNQKAFKEKFPVPPKTPIVVPTVEIFIMTEPLYLGGRYLKFARDIGQTPWVINGRQMTETSVQEIIFNSINKVLG